MQKEKAVRVQRIYRENIPPAPLEKGGVSIESVGLDPGRMGRSGQGGRVDGTKDKG